MVLISIVGLELLETKHISRDMWKPLHARRELACFFGVPKWQKLNGYDILEEKPTVVWGIDEPILHQQPLNVGAT